jgi:hypothetical protein
MAFYRFNHLRVDGGTISEITTHPDYLFAIEEWEKIRDVIQGSRFVKERGEKYLPRLYDQSNEEYEAYKMRALFFNGTRRTREAGVGLIMRKTPTIQVDETVESRFGDVDLKGSTLNDYLRTVTEETSSLGRSGTLVDWSEEEKRFYFAFYHAEDIIDWEERRIGGRMKLSRLKLREFGVIRDPAAGPDGAPGYGTHTVEETISEYRLEAESNICVVEKWTVKNGSITPKLAPVEMKHRGGTFDWIPFVFHGIDGNRCDVAISPLSDLADVNISHYQTSADIENGRHVCGIPTPYAAGFDAGTELILGSSRAWVSEAVDAKAGFIEFTGQGLTALEKAMSEKQSQMAMLGARMLETQKTEAEAFGTVQLRSNSEQASLVNISEAVSATMSACLKIAAWWEGTKDKKVEDFAEGNTIVLNTDFVASKIDGPTLAALVAAYQSGAISWQTFFYQLEQGEFYKDQWTADEEEAALLQKPVTPPPPTDPDPGNSAE